ncbi:MAG: uroporphyrinogen decarboxylase family protein [Treponema sp.]|nr:uroporphyrinogen decarboxylase family protein [Treponema sp.]
MCDSLKAKFRDRYKTDDYLSFYDIPFAYAGNGPSRNTVDYSSYFSPGEVDYINHYGVGRKKGSIAHFEKFISPMRNFTSPEQVWAFPMEDYLAGYRWDGLAEKTAALKKKDKIVISGGLVIDIFEPAWYLRGMENLLVDFLTDPQMAAACLDRMAELKYGAAARYAAAGVDVIIYGDDVGTERDMMMAPETWREWLKPRLAKAIRAAKDVNQDVLVYYHSDGDIRQIIDDLIEIGIDILNPVQPECMDPFQIYNQYKDRISFWGCIGTQTTMPFGTPDDIRKTVNSLLDLGRNDGRLILAPTHVLEPEVPLENVDAFVYAVKSFVPQN